MGKKGKGKKKQVENPEEQQQQTGPPVAQQQQQQTGPPVAQQQQQQTGPPVAQQQQQQTGPPVAQQQQRGPSGDRQQKGPPGAQQQKGPSGAQQQREPGPQQQQQGPPAAWQQRGRGTQQQQQGPPAAWQQRGRGTQQQQQGPSAAWQQRGPGPQQQQQGPPAAGQQRGPGPQQQQQRPPTPQQQQQGPPAAWQQRGPGPQQQQQRPPTPQQQQQGPPAAWQQRGPGPQQQQQGPSAAGQQRGPGPQQQQQRPPTPQQQQQGPPATWQQRGPGPQQQQQRPPTPQQQQQGPPAAWQQRGPGPQQQQQGPSAAGQQRGPGPQQQQQRPPTPQQQQQGPPATWQQRGPGPQQQQQRPPTPQQQQQGPPATWQQRGPGPQQQQHGGPVPQQQQGGPVPRQQQGGPVSRQQQGGPVSRQQQGGSSGTLRPQQQKPRTVPVQSQYQPKTYCGDTKELDSALVEKYLSQIPKRLNMSGGTAGRRIIVETNMLKINLDKFQTCVSHYDVVIEPDKPKFLMRPVFEAYRQKRFPQRYPAFDGKKNAYSAKDLPFGIESPQEEVTVYDEERQQERTFKVHMRRVNILDLSWLNTVECGKTELTKEQNTLQALDIILRHGAAATHVNVGRSLFRPPEGTVVSLSNGLDLWVGIFQSAVIGWKPFLNIDVAHKGFPTPQSVIDLLKDLCKHPKDLQPLEHIGPRDVANHQEDIIKFLKGLKIQYEIPGQPNSKRTYRVNELAPSARENRFALENGQQCTVEQYFAQQKNYKLRYPELPCLWVGSRVSQRKIHLPAELCTIVAGQVTQKKMSEVSTSKMIKYAATNTTIRKEKIKSGFSKMRINEQPTLLQEFKLSVNHDFEKTPARVLQAPQLQYDRPHPVSVMKGVWRADKFLNPSSLGDDEWTILNLDRYTQERALYDLCSQLQQGGRDINLRIGKPKTPFACLRSSEFQKLESYFKERKSDKIRLVVVIIPTFDNSYCYVKQYSELKTPGGMITQVLKAQTLRKLSPATITNILLKINSKLNGVNHKLMQSPKCLQKPCMLVGADVTHPAPDAQETPSIAAVTASYSPTAFQYNIELRLQPPREEMIKDLEEIMVLQLSYFYKATKHRPQQIIFYRDGVSEGQLPQVLHYEMSAIKRAVARMGSGELKIPITFLVVQKRHHTRFFPTDTRNSDDRNLNVQAGTIVDTNITHPTHIDFYLVSHASIQGTARPTKYRCIANEIGMTEDEIEQLTYYLCHLFARCTRSVSYPAPTYYAHLAAFRARALISGAKVDIHNLKTEQREKLSLQMEDSPMFFV